jgi:hypothetical protein
VGLSLRCSSSSICVVLLHICVLIPILSISTLALMETSTYIVLMRRFVTQKPSNEAWSLRKTGTHMERFLSRQNEGSATLVMLDYWIIAHPSTGRRLEDSI